MTSLKWEYAMKKITSADNRKFVKVADVEKLIGTVKNGEFYSVIFERVAPKCSNCGKSNKKWIGLDTCPICDTPLSKERESLAQNGVHNPQDETITPKGIGETTAEARECGRIKYYDPILENYRQFYAVNVKRLKIRGIEYIVVK